MVGRVVWSRCGSKDYSRTLNPCQAGSGFYSQSPVQLPFYATARWLFCDEAQGLRLHRCDNGAGLSRFAGIDLSLRASGDNSITRMQRRGDTIETPLQRSGPRTTSATPTTVSAMPASIVGVNDSPNKIHASPAVQGGTRYNRLVTWVAAPRCINR